MARVRTEEKRDEIVRIAAELFGKHGFERCSMAALSERIGGSKATLYGYFPSKEDLLRAVLNCEVAKDADNVIRDFPAKDDLRESLILLGTSYLNKRMSPFPLANIRMIANQPAVAANRALMIGQMKELAGFLHSDQSKGKPTLWLAPEDVASTLEVAKAIAEYASS